MSSLRPVAGTAAEVLALLRGFEAADDPAPLVVATSGSTGRPKRVLLSRAALRASADATHARLGGPGRWVLDLPPTYVAGLQVLFRSVRAGTEPLAAGERADHRGGSAQGRAYVSVVPTQLVRALAEPERTAELAGFDAVLVGGGPLDARVRARAEAAGIRVVQTYGMSETCGGCVYDGLPLDGVRLRVDDTGQVLVAGPVLFDGYEGEPERTAAALDDGWLRTHDLGTLDAGGRLRILGRADDVVISGGVKVPPVAVQQALELHPAVAAVHVVGLPDPEWGEQVVAVVVPATDRPGDPPVLAELRDLVSPRSWAPRRLVLTDALPLLPTGKVDAAAVRAIAREAAGA